MIITFEILHSRLSEYIAFLSGKDLILYNYNLILFKNGLRAREVHEMDRWSRNPDKTFTCITEKNSNPRIFTTEDLSEYFIYHINNNLNAWNYNSYDTMNFYFKRSSNCANIKHMYKNLSISLYRHHFCKQLHELGWTDEAIQAKLGEKDIRNSNNYIYSVLYE